MVAITFVRPFMQRLTTLSSDEPMNNEHGVAIKTGNIFYCTCHDLIDDKAEEKRHFVGE